MLETLRIQDYALIHEIELEFQHALNVLTGETGAGKSIIVGALNLVLGARASSDLVREGARRAKVNAVFHIDRPAQRLARILKDHDVELADGELLLSRTVTADGRSRAYAGGSLVPVAVLAAIGDELVDLHGQHEHQSLLKTDRQLDLLDGFAGLDEATAALAEHVRELRVLEKSIAELETDDRERQRRLDFLRFEANEIDAAELEVGEEESLKARRNLIANAETIVSLASQIAGALYENEDAAAIDSVDTALRAMTELAHIDERFKPLLARLEAIRSEVDDLSREAQGFVDHVDFDPGELDSVNQRLAVIGDLKRKFGDSIEAVLAYRDKAALEIEAHDQRDRRLAELQATHGEVAATAHEAAGTLSRKRKDAAKRLDKRVSANLQELGMKGGKFETQFDAIPLSLTGVDRIEFLLAANPGEKVKPLRQVASGGEISRVMLALKTTFAHADKIPTLIFDEIDAGVGGVMAGKVAGKLTELAESHQTICITHLPQIAATAQAHYHVSKTETDGRTVTTVSRVEGHDRVEELARLLDGSVSKLSLKHAQALLQAAR